MMNELDDNMDDTPLEEGDLILEEYDRFDEDEEDGYDPFEDEDEDEDS